MRPAKSESQNAQVDIFLAMAYPIRIMLLTVVFKVVHIFLWQISLAMFKVTRLAVFAHHDHLG